MSTKEELEERLNTSFEFATKAYDEQNGSLYMTIDIKFKKLNSENTGLVMVLGDTETVNQRFNIMAKMGRTMGSLMVEEKILGVEDILFFSEAWVSQQKIEKSDKGKKIEPKNFKMPSEDPNKREVVMATITDGQTIIMKAKEIKRFFSGDKVQVKLEDTELAGQMNDMKVNGTSESPLLKSFYDAYKECVDKKIVLSEEQVFNIKL